MGDLDPKALEAAAFAVMRKDGCGLTARGERVFCDDLRVPREYRQVDCSCKISARTAIEAYLSTLKSLKKQRSIVKPTVTP